MFDGLLGDIKLDVGLLGDIKPAVGLLGDIKVDVGLLGDIKPDVAFTALVATLSLPSGRVVLVEALGVTGLDVLQCSD